MKKKIVIGAVLALAAVAAIVYKNKDQEARAPQNPTSGQQQLVEQKTELAPAINGVLVEPEAAGRRVIAVMVENHPESRPQSGLAEADLVYEAVAEGGITRFIAVYQTKEAQSIGPVRSARDYFAVLTDELGALYAHVGGSDEVLDQLKRGIYKNLSDANEYYNENYFQRITSRAAPHNVYTSIAKLKSLAEHRQYGQEANFSPWKFKDDSPASSTASRIDMEFSLPGFNVAYEYDRGSNGYKRLLAGKAHMDAATRQQITAKNVVVQFVKVTPIPNDPKLRVDIAVYGTGKAVVFQDGRAIKAAWKKEGAARTRYYTEQGEEISFNRGSTWVELVSVEKEPQLKWSAPVLP
jgi:hypothetical protein